MAPPLRNNRDFGTFRLAALKEITPIHTIAEVRKVFGRVSAPDWSAQAQEQPSARADRMVSFPPA